MTARSSNSGCASRCLRVGTANCGVPQKRMRISTPLRPSTGRLRRLPLALLPEFLDFALDEVALQHAEMLEKEDAVEMINLVAESAGKEIFAANFVGLAFGVLGLHGNKLRTDDVAPEAGNGEAALFFADFSLGVNN